MDTSLSMVGIRHYLGAHPWSSTVQYYDQVTSTNILAKEQAKNGAPDGTALIADHQTAGRGRLGREFFSPQNMGIYLSVIIRPDCKPSDLMHLTCAVAVAMCDAIEDVCGFRPQIKWTNDLIYDQKKLGGILTELDIDTKTGIVRSAILGIGINCCQKESDFIPSIQSMASSLQMVTNTPVNRNLLAAEIIRCLCSMKTQLLWSKSSILAQYRKDCYTIGKEISVVCGPNVLHGIAKDIDSDGALVIQFPDGRCAPINAGEVSIRGLYGYV